MRIGAVLAGLALFTISPGIAQDDGEYYSGEQEILDQIEAEDDSLSGGDEEEYYIYVTPLTTEDVTDDYWDSLETDTETMRDEGEQGFDTPGALEILQEDFDALPVEVPVVPEPTPVDEEEE